MKKKQAELQNNFADMLDAAIAEAKGITSDAHKVVDIITFCEDSKYLNLLGQDPPLNLWPMQKIVLKIFYRGTPGNEHIQLTGEEEQVLFDISISEELDYDLEKGGFTQVINKYKRSSLFTHMLLIMGRRSSKTTLVSLIAAYESYKLLESPEGNPQKKYGIAPDKNIHIINVATNENQALDPLFVEIESRLSRSPYFANKINQSKSRKGKIHLLTESDKRENEARIKRGMGVLVDGSIVLLSGHSNSSGLRGHATIVLLFDEFAHFVTSSGRSSGDEVYNALIPSMKQFGSDGKVVMLSDPKGKQGMFWRLFQMSQEEKSAENGEKTYPHDHLLSIQLPTWRMNPTKEFTREVLEKTEKPKDPTVFHTSYGARFVGIEGIRLFDSEKIDFAIDAAKREPERGDSRYMYYVHLDPATTSHNYALSMCHKETLSSPFFGTRTKIVLDICKFWTPQEGRPIEIKLIENYIKELCSKFRISSVTFDTFQSAQTIQNLKFMNINAFETPFNDHYLIEIYGHLKTLLNEGDLILYPNEKLIGEMKCILGRVAKFGLRRFADKKSEYPTDDCCDSLAGAVYQCLQKVMVPSLPTSRVVRLGFK